MEARIALVVDLIGRRLHKHQIKSVLREFAAKQMPLTYKGGAEKLTARTIEDYISRARERILGNNIETANEQFRVSKALYEGIIRDPKSSNRERMEAQRELNRMYGIDQPGRILFNPNPEQPLENQTSDDSETRPAVLQALEVVYGAGRQAMA